VNKELWIGVKSKRSCPLCGVDDFVVVSQKMQYGLDLTTVICNKCSMVFTNPIPSENVYNRFYVEAYADYYGEIAGNDDLSKYTVEPEYIKIILDALEKYLVLQDVKLLEVGPGKGQFLFWAKQRGATIQGVEPSKSFHNTLINNNLPSINATLQDMSHVTNNTYDCIVMFHVLEHFYNSNDALQVCRQLLNDNGLLTIMVPNILKPYRSLEHYFLRYVHLSNFSPYTLVNMLEKHGFSILYSEIQGKEKWYQPHNLFVIARKEEQMPENFKLPTQHADEVLQILDAYRISWRWIKGPYWHLYIGYKLTKKIIYRLGKFLKRQLIRKGLL